MRERPIFAWLGRVWAPGSRRSSARCSRRVRRRAHRISSARPPISQEVLSLTNGLSFEVAAPVSLELQCGVMNGSVQVDLGWIGATRVNELVVQPTVGGP